MAKALMSSNTFFVNLYIQAVLLKVVNNILLNMNTENFTRLIDVQKLPNGNAFEALKRYTLTLSRFWIRKNSNDSD